jgi:hypothetical protein
MPEMQWKQIRIITKGSKREDKETDRNEKPAYRVRAVMPSPSYFEQKENQNSE